MTKLFLFLGAINGFLAVGLGAFGAHGLRGRLSPQLLEAYHTGVQYHTTHALALLVVGIVAHWIPDSPYLKGAGWSLVAGIVLFSGSLYVLSVTGTRWLGAITPLGGMAFLIAWVLFAIAVLKT